MASWIPRPLVVVLSVLTILAGAQFVGIAVSAQSSTETEFVRLMNDERAAQGLRPVQINERLSRAAYLHSKDMAENGYFSHTSQDGRTLRDRVEDQGYMDWQRIAENIAWHGGDPDAARVFDMWKNSAGHYRNMMGDYNEAGLGHYTHNNRTHYTLDLGYRSAAQQTPTPTLAPTATPTSVPTATPSPTATPTLVPTASPTPTPVPTATPAPTPPPMPRWWDWRRWF